MEGVIGRFLRIPTVISIVIQKEVVTTHTTEAEVGPRCLIISTTDNIKMARCASHSRPSRFVRECLFFFLVLGPSLPARPFLEVAFYFDIALD